LEEVVETERSKGQKDQYYHLAMPLKQVSCYACSDLIIACFHVIAHCPARIWRH